MWTFLSMVLPAPTSEPWPILVPSVMIVGSPLRWGLFGSAQKGALSIRVRCRRPAGPRGSRRPLTLQKPDVLPRAILGCHQRDRGSSTWSDYRRRHVPGGASMGLASRLFRTRGA